MSKSLVVVGDADALIAQLHLHDKNHARAKQIGNLLHKQRSQLSFPITAISEAITVLKFRKVDPHALKKLIAYSTSGRIVVDDVDLSAFQRAATLFDHGDSKRNTYFDALVAAIAIQKRAAAIFSFDSWYTKKGFTLAEELL